MKNINRRSALKLIATLPFIGTALAEAASKPSVASDFELNEWSLVKGGGKDSFPIRGKVIAIIGYGPELDQTRRDLLSYWQENGVEISPHDSLYTKLHNANAAADVGLNVLIIEVMKPRCIHDGRIYAFPPEVFDGLMKTDGIYVVQPEYEVIFCQPSEHRSATEASHQPHICTRVGRFVVDLDAKPNRLVERPNFLVQSSTVC
jgi:hypothetical protein